MAEPTRSWQVKADIPLRCFVVVTMCICAVIFAVAAGVLANTGGYGWGVFAGLSFGLTVGAMMHV
ncbi:hypothetical protein RQ831_18440 [Roseomonas gilardii]|uniref:Uncharacterized protein n=1 Tax=Roseomonas gilardii TaxID=257708 RepID=A0ABU3MJ52_9PROT|nr:hypothetical protein [Roseomonas gilardii]MDT8333036.1 hypothetical protein [Roseomonas gilardii]